MATATVRSPAYVPIEDVSVVPPLHTVSAGTVTTRYMDLEKMMATTDGSGILAHHPWLHRHPTRDGFHGHGLACNYGGVLTSADGETDRWGREISQQLTWDIQHGRQY